MRCPWIGSQCRFEPTCSAYALQALQEHGAAGGSYLAARRVLRCHPETGELREVKIRSTCCLIYKVPNARMCSDCPLRDKHDLVREAGECR